MDLFKRFPLSTASALALFTLLYAGGEVRADDFELRGIVGFTNVQQGTTEGGIVPYLGVGLSKLIGPNVQSGSIRNLTGLMPVDASTFTFKGEVGPHPLLPGHPAVHVIRTAQGDIHCTWTAVFTLKFINAQFDAVLSGDGDFKVFGGTGRYRNATGRFRTLFQSEPVAYGADEAVAEVSQSGDISRR